MKNKEEIEFNFVLRLMAFPFILGLILIKYNYHALRNTICFLFYGGEWITYAKEDKVTIQDIYMELKNNKNDGNNRINR
jgi:hypothetical protein